MMTDPPPNSIRGKTLIVDAKDATRTRDTVRHYSMQENMTRSLFVPGSTRKKSLSRGDRSFGGAGRDEVRFFPSWGAPLSQQVPSGRISGITFRYVGSDQNSAMNLLDSSCAVTQCRATEGILSGV